MVFFRNNWKTTLQLDGKELRHFGFIFSAILAAIGAWSTYKNGFLVWNSAALMAAVTIFLLSILYPAFLRPIYFLALSFGKAMGTVQTWVILNLMYWLIILPLGYMLRLTGRLPSLEIDPKMDTYRIAVLDKNLTQKKEKSF